MSLMLRFHTAFNYGDDFIYVIVFKIVYNKEEHRWNIAKYDRTSKGENHKISCLQGKWKAIN